MDCLSIIHPDTSITTEPTFYKVLVAAQTYHESSLLPNSSYLNTAMRDLGLSDEHEQKIFTEAMTLKPMLDSAVLYEAIAAEAFRKDFKGKAGIEKLLKNFRFLAPSDQETMIEGVLLHIFTVLGQRIDYTNIDYVQTLAKRYQMDDQSFQRLYQSFTNMEWHDEAAEIVILDFMRSPTPLLIESIASIQKNFLGGILKKAIPLPAKFDPTVPTEDNAIKFKHYIVNLNTRAGKQFVAQNWTKMSLPQLKTIQASHLWPSLSDAVRSSIESKLPKDASNETPEAKQSKLSRVSQSDLQNSTATISFERQNEFFNTARALNKTNNSTIALELFVKAMQLAQNPNELIYFYNKYGHGPDETEVSRQTKQANVIKHFHYMIDLKPTLSDIKTLLNQALFTDVEIEKAILSQSSSLAITATEYINLFTLDYIDSPRFRDQRRIAISQACSATLSHFFNFNPTVDEVRSLIIAGVFPTDLEKNKIGTLEQILTTAAEKVNSTKDYIALFSEFPRISTSSFNNIRALALTLSLHHFRELGADTLDVEKLISESKLSPRIAKTIRKDYQTP